jgi:hypothetical protein
MKYQKIKSSIPLVVGGMLLSFILLMLSASTPARTDITHQPKIDDFMASSLLDTLWIATHNAGSFSLTLTNIGILGSGAFDTLSSYQGGPFVSCQFPKDSDIEYLYMGTYWFGGIVGNDTLVSVGADGWIGVGELYPDSGEAEKFGIRSNNPLSPFYSLDAISEVDFLLTLYDTITDTNETGVDPTDARPHMPLNIQYDQKTYSWSDSEIDDFVMFDCYIKNIGLETINDFWTGIFLDGDVMHVSNGNGYLDDITGFLPAENIAYILDNDGDPNGAIWDAMSPRAAMGLKFHGSQPTANAVNFNWWLSSDNASLDFGPRLAGTPEDPFRSFGTHLGTPNGDKNKYYIMSHSETDYDQLFTSLDNTGQGFMAPPANLLDIADGYDTRCLISFGPFDLVPGDSIRFFYSIVMGDNVHVNPSDFATFYNSSNPQAYLDQLDFGELIANANAADSIFQEVADFVVDADDDASPLANIFSLSDNYPNPFNPATRIEYTIPKQTRIELTVFDILGRTVRTLVDANKQAGSYTAVWDGLDATGKRVASGIYFYRLKADDFTETKKMVLLK